MLWPLEENLSFLLEEKVPTLLMVCGSETASVDQQVTRDGFSGYRLANHLWSVVSEGTLALHPHLHTS